MDENVELAIKITTKNLRIDAALTAGGCLYHYTSVYALKNIIEEKKLWVSKSDFLNDSTELVYIHKVLKKALQELDQTITDSSFLLLFEDLVEDIELLYIDTYVLSMSENPDSITLWSGYSNNDGYCLGFETMDFVSKVKDTGFLHWFGRVNYDLSRQTHILIDEIKEYYGYWVKHATSKERNTIWKKLVQKFWLYSIFYKDPKFSHEEEYRVAFLLNKPGSSTLKTDKNSEIAEYRIKDGAIIPFIKLDLKELPLSSITIGPKNNIDIAKLGLANFLKKHNLSSCTINKSEIPLRY